MRDMLTETTARYLIFIMWERVTLWERAMPAIGKEQTSSPEPGAVQRNASANIDTRPPRQPIPIMTRETLNATTLCWILAALFTTPLCAGSETLQLNEQEYF